MGVSGSFVDGGDPIGIGWPIPFESRTSKEEDECYYFD